MSYCFFKLLELTCFVMALVLQNGVLQSDSEPKKEEVDSIEVIKFDSTTSSWLDSNYPPETLIDGNESPELSKGSCFHSNAKKPWVAIHREKAAVIKRVDILNRKMEDDVPSHERVKGLVVEVCKNREKWEEWKSTKVGCEKFGTVKDTPDGEWIEVSGDKENIEGNTIVLHHTKNQHINLCEVKVVGREIPPPTTTITTTTPTSTTTTPTTTTTTPTTTTTTPTTTTTTPTTTTTTPTTTTTTPTTTTTTRTTTTTLFSETTPSTATAISTTFEKVVLLSLVTIVKVKVLQHNW